jgi:hypothetical protein
MKRVLADRVVLIHPSVVPAMSLFVNRRCFSRSNPNVWMIEALEFVGIAEETASEFKERRTVRELRAASSDFI